MDFRSNKSRNQTPQQPVRPTGVFRFSSLKLEGLRIGLYAVISLTLVMALGFSDLGRWLTANLDRPLVYRVRDFFGKSPEVAPGFVPILFDDAALTWIGSTEPDLSQWAQVLNAVGSRRPAAIVINKVFGVLPHGTSEADISSFVRTLKNLRSRDSVQVFAGAYFTPDKNDFKETVDLEKLAHSRTYSWGFEPGMSLDEQAAKLGFRFSDRSEEFLYGPDKRIMDALSGIGVVNYQIDGLIPASNRTSGDILLPHLALVSFPNKTPGNGFTFINGAKVPINDRGEILPNIVNRKNLLQRSVSMKHFLDPSTRQDAAAKTITPGDVVLIGFNSTDSSDALVPTPIGRLPSSLFMASLMNSIVARKLISEAPLRELWWAFGSLSALIALLRLPVSFSILALTGIVLVWPIASSLIFTFFSIHVPWVVPALGAILPGILVISRKVKVSRENAIRVAAALDGRIPSDTMSSLVRNPEQLNLGCREVPVTIMFIDIAGFSLFAERRGAQEVFNYLRSALNQATKLVLEYGGVVDKTMGDGLLAYFGQPVGAQEDQRDHATRAFDCAKAIQSERLITSKRAITNGDAVLPFRIGINTGTCMLGDLGTEHRLDVTIIGGGVNFAKRLEDACEPGTILVSSTTYSLAVPVGERGGFVRKFVRMKHMNALVEAFEFDPLASEPQEKVKIIEAFRSTIAIERVDRRWVVPDGKVVEVSSEFGIKELVNFSGRGFATRLPAPFARGSRINFRIHTPELAAELAKHGIQSIEAEVRWNHGTGESVFHGFSIHGFSEDQAAAFNKVLLEYCFSEDLFRLPRIG